MKLKYSLLALIAVLFIISCSGYDREEFRMETGKKYALKKWPDSAYVDTLDRFFEKEPVKQQRKQKAEISMSMDNKAMKLPGKKPGAAEKKQQGASAKDVPKKNDEKSEGGKNDKSFPDQFFEALDKLSENPNDREHGKRHKAKAGETLDDLLLRVYGAKIKRVPKYLSEDMLKRLNQGANFSSLSEGDMVLLPNVR